MSFVGPLAFCRMDDALVGRIARREGLGRVGLSAVLAMAIGGAVYGAAFGIWRGWDQTLFSAIKLPVVLLAVAAATVLLNAVLAMLLRADLGLRQSAVCVLIGLATSACVLAALAPISGAIALTVQPPDPSLLGLMADDPRVAPNGHVSQALLLMHVLCIAVAGVLGNLRLAALLRRLTGKRPIAARVLVAWLLGELFVGSQLSWLLRPFLGRPHRVPTFFDQDPLAGGFFEEIWTAMREALGVPGTIGLAIALVTIALTGWAILRPDGAPAELEAADERGLTLAAEAWRVSLAWDAVHHLWRRRATALFEDAEELVLELDRGPARRVLVRYPDAALADDALARLSALRTRTRGDGPFRSAVLAPG